MNDSNNVCLLQFRRLMFARNTLDTKESSTPSHSDPKDVLLQYAAPLSALHKSASKYYY